jgi:hypothetical protein
MLRTFVLILATLGSWAALGETAPTPTAPGQPPAEPPLVPGQPPTDMGMPVSPHQEQTERHLETHGPRFKALDMDRNGVISAEEAKSDPALSKQWKSLDQNGDGQLDPIEFSKFEQGAATP